MEVYYKGWKKLKRSAPQITEDNALSVPKSFVTCSRIFCSLGSRIKLPLIIYCHMSGSRSKSRRVRVMLRPRGDAVEAGCDAEVPQVTEDNAVLPKVVTCSCIFSSCGCSAYFRLVMLPRMIDFNNTDAIIGSPKRDSEEVNLISGPASSRAPSHLGVNIDLALIRKQLTKGSTYWNLERSKSQGYSGDEELF
ncbi:hypothetical protein C5167_051123 [Papaver somniferum]|uniref:Uncharacterized protein n=1 Tax=Papaver somniferum TaxID=3469 RepID=A0A4Y7KTX6_PAPSO|nr:hypothetical protein C5167_051123 [Papaver somniferum]